MRKILIGVVVGVILGTATVADAAIPDSQGEINACRNKSTGAVRVIDKALGQKCSTTEVSFKWNQTGPAGPAGPTGPAGPAGSQPSYLARHDPREASIEFENGVRKTLESIDFTTVTPSWYFMAAQVHVTQGWSGKLRCSLGGGNEEPYGGDFDSIEVSVGGVIRLQTTIYVYERPVELSCTAEGLADGELARVTEDELTMIGISPQQR